MHRHCQDADNMDAHVLYQKIGPVYAAAAMWAMAEQYG